MKSLHATAAFAAAALAGIAAVPGLAMADESSGWEWKVIPYLWMSNVEADLAVNDRQINVEQSFGDILDKLDGAFQVHFEGAKDEYGFFADYTYLSLGDKSRTGPLTLDSDMKLQLFELAGVYRPTGQFEGFQAFAGIRYISVDQATAISGEGPLPVSPEISLDKSATDFLVGARYLGSFSDNWYYSLRADASGGSTEGTWSLSGLVGYRFPGWQKGSAILGYRHMQIDFEDSNAGNDIRLDLTMTGPFLGLGIDF